MKCSIVLEAGLAIKYHCSSERYLALEIENLSLMDGCPVQPVPWRQGVNARDSGGLKSQFMRSAKHPVRDGLAGNPQVGSRPLPPEDRRCRIGALLSAHLLKPRRFAHLRRIADEAPARRRAGRILRFQPSLILFPVGGLTQNRACHHSVHALLTKVCSLNQ
jgi:hypothetical protein